MVWEFLVRKLGTNIGLNVLDKLLLAKNAWLSGEVGESQAHIS
jgi:hypothetical protein